jgi:hypothetical protein
MILPEIRFDTRSKRVRQAGASAGRDEIEIPVQFRTKNGHFRAFRCIWSARRSLPFSKFLREQSPLAEALKSGCGGGI